MSEAVVRVFEMSLWTPEAMGWVLETSWRTLETMFSGFVTS